jgi:alpha-1,3-rhamnosyl/mannosyltransferase
MVTIGVDARTIYRTNRRGTGKNLVDLYRWLAKVRPDWNFIFYHQLEEKDYVGQTPSFVHYSTTEGSCRTQKNVGQVPPLVQDSTIGGDCRTFIAKRIDIPGDRFNFWEDVRFPFEVWRDGCDIVHSPANSCPYFVFNPLVVTIHDLIPLEKGYGGKSVRYWEKRLLRAVKAAKKIITPSEFSRSKIVERFGVSTDKVIVNPWAPDDGLERVTDDSELSRVRSEYGLPTDRPYVFGFGGVDPRKNTERVIDAWGELPGRMKREFALLLVGIQESGLQGFRDRVRAKGLEESCRIFGFAAEKDISALLSGSVGLIYASLSEGFGLPILDAFLCQTPVVTSCVTSMPEAAGDAALLVDPESVESIRDGLKKLLENEGLRNELIGKGLERVKRFTWHRCAERAAWVFEEVMEKSA